VCFISTILGIVGSIHLIQKYVSLKNEKRGSRKEKPEKSEFSFMQTKEGDDDWVLNSIASIKKISKIKRISKKNKLKISKINLYQKHFIKKKTIN